MNTPAPILKNPNVLQIRKFIQHKVLKDDVKIQLQISLKVVETGQYDKKKKNLK